MKMLGKCSFVISGILFVNAIAGAATSGPNDGYVEMQGQILEGACNVDTASQDQIVDMERQPVSDLVSNGNSAPRSFSIKLVGCTPEKYNPNLASNNAQSFRVSFNGSQDEHNFSVNGNAKGVELEISDIAGNIAQPGENLPPVQITSGAMKMDYRIRLVGDGQPIYPGTYHSTIRYKIDYY